MKGLPQQVDQHVTSHVHRVRVRSDCKAVRWMRGIAKRLHAAKRRLRTDKRVRREFFANGTEPNRHELWAVKKILAVKRPPGRGRKLSVCVRWVGRWQDEWINVTWLNKAARLEARAMEARIFGLSSANSRSATRPTPSRVQPPRGGRAVAALVGEEEEIRRPRLRRTFRVIEDSDSDDSSDWGGSPLLPARVARRPHCCVSDSDEESSSMSKTPRVACNTVGAVHHLSARGDVAHGS